MISTNPETVESIVYPFENTGAIPILEGQYSGVSVVMRHKDTMLGSGVMMLATAHDRYDPLFEPSGNKVNVSPEFTSFFNGFYAARQCLIAAGINMDMRYDRQVAWAISSYLPLDFMELRQPHQMGQERDRIDELGSDVRRIGLYSYEKVYPSFGMFFDKNLDGVDPSMPAERHITNDPFIRTGAGWATLLHATLIQKHFESLANGELGAEIAKLEDPEFDIDAALRSLTEDPNI